MEEIIERLRKIEEAIEELQRVVRELESRVWSVENDEDYGA